MTTNWIDLQPQALATLLDWYAPHQMASADNLNALHVAIDTVINTISFKLGVDGLAVFDDCCTCLDAYVALPEQASFQKDISKWWFGPESPAAGQLDAKELSEAHLDRVIEAVGTDMDVQLRLCIAQLVVLSAASADEGQEARFVEEGRFKIVGGPDSSEGPWVAVFTHADGARSRLVVEQGYYQNFAPKGMLRQLQETLIPQRRASDGDLVGVEFRYHTDHTGYVLGLMDPVAQCGRAFYKQADGFVARDFKEAESDDLDRIAGATLRHDRLSDHFAMAADIERNLATVSVVCFQEFAVLIQDPEEWLMTWNEGSPDGSPVRVWVDKDSTEKPGLRDVVAETIGGLDDLWSRDLYTMLDAYAD